MELVQLIVQKKWNGRKRSETVGNGRKHDQAKTCSTPHLFLNKHFRATPFFFEGPKVSKGKRLETVGDGTFARQKSTCFYTIFKHFSWTYAKKQVLFCRAKVPSPAVSNRFPLDTFGPSKKTALRGNAYLKTNVGWTSFGLIMFPTVSDCFRPFHFFWTINWTNSIYGRLIQCKPVQTMTLKFFGATLVRVHCTKYCILTLISNIP